MLTLKPAFASAELRWTCPAGRASLQAYARLEAGFFHVNILWSAYPEMGAAFAVNNKSSDGIYWLQVFGAAR